MSQIGGNRPPVDVAAAGRDGRRLLWRARVAAFAVAAAAAAVVLGVGFGARAAIDRSDESPATNSTLPTDSTQPTDTSGVPDSTPPPDSTMDTAPPDDAPPEVGEVNVSPKLLYTPGCDPTTAAVSADVTDDDLESVTLHWSLDNLEDSRQMTGGPTFSATLGPFADAEGSPATITVTVEANDAAGNLTERSTTATLYDCVD